MKSINEVMVAVEWWMKEINWGRLSASSQQISFFKDHLHTFIEGCLEKNQDEPRSYLEVDYHPRGELLNLLVKAGFEPSKLRFCTIHDKAYMLIDHRNGIIEVDEETVFAQPELEIVKALMNKS